MQSQQGFQASSYTKCIYLATGKSGKNNISKSIRDAIDLIRIRIRQTIPATGAIPVAGNKIMRRCYI